MQGKRILLGVSGSIAAYKAAFLVRLLVKAGAEVRVVMTASAREFITPLTLSTLSKHPVLSEFTTTDGTGTWNNHVELGLWADVVLIAPASARTLARCAHGLADDLLSAVYLSARCPVFFAPAMDLDMYQHPATTENLRRLTSFGNRIIEAESGELASGLVGQGRMAEPERMVRVLEIFLTPENTPNPLKGAFLSENFSRENAPFRGLGVLITAGPTQEAIDPVRFISNQSTGKMGYALAAELQAVGAHVTLVSGPVALPLPHPDIRLVQVRSAQQMFEAAQAHFTNADVVILSAAVADYTPTHPADRKIKKKEAVFTIELSKTVDIAATLGQQKRPDQVLVGFALETDNELENARAKLNSKNLDLIVLNSLQDPGAGFGHDTNQVTVLDRNGGVQKIPLQSKQELAKDLVEIIAKLVSSTRVVLKS
ncbi:MAG: bifunctional phosphopantothenoylcysteine decarboxylase/phosphopantothenate--cysteine ligase CoaBC [Cytophagaceae bacterium]|nr:bifunctional phosphopantothenoylcysteine decarboxylase/phosphopantothenate--cysteine ligase CoaBC [Cytophagaceae bacterium]